MASPILRSTLCSLLLVSVALLACKQGGTKEVKGSCDMRGPAATSGGSAICIDFHSEPNEKVKQICSAASGYILGPGACDRSTALGGCPSGKLTNWYYPSSRHSTAADVKNECPGDFVAPTGS